MSQRRSSARRHNRSKAITEGVQNVGTFLSNLASRFARQFTRRNRDHLVVPINESPRRSKSSSPRRSKSSSPRRSNNRSSTYIIPSSQVISNPELVTSITNNNKFKKTSKTSFKTSPKEFTALGLKSTFSRRKLTKSGAKSNKKRK
jgi:hypothetical protein